MVYSKTSISINKYTCRRQVWYIVKHQSVLINIHTCRRQGSLRMMLGFSKHIANLCKVQSMNDNCGEWVECVGVASGCG